MVLVDTSVWVNHLRRGEPHLTGLLAAGQVATHPFVVGELACGNLRNRREILASLNALPVVDIASHEEALQLIEKKTLHGKGLGWIDVHLLASALLSGVPLWTKDKSLAEAAEDLSVAE